ncbi:MAG: membrane protein insertase YidC [Muribaculaceae bacterium]|nr:membrane protein insertase YidC [Muribaculaceae bacterium]
MDKNTVMGLVCMAAVIFGFLYFSKPAPAEQEQAQQATESVTEKKDTRQQQAVDSLTVNDLRALAVAVEQSGVAVGDHKSLVAAGYSFSTDTSAVGVSGNVTVDGAVIDITQLTGNNLSLTPDQLVKGVAAVRGVVASSQRYKSFARYIGGADSLITLENKVMKVTFSSRGGMVRQVELKDYMNERKGSDAHVCLFADATDGYDFTLRTADAEIRTSELNFTPTVDGNTITMGLELGNNAAWGIRYTITGDDQYLVKMELVQNNITAILPSGTTSVAFNWHQKMGRNEQGRSFEENNSAIYYQLKGKNPDDLSSKGDDSESLSAAVKWVAFKNQFFSSIIIPAGSFTSAELKSEALSNDPDYLKIMQMSATTPYNTADGVAASFHFFFGPNNYPMLSVLDKTIGSDEDLHLNRLVPLGWGLFRWINQLIIIPVFTFLSHFISNYGIIILLLTIFIKLIIFPFTYKSYKSQARMRVLAPEIKEINDKYPGQENAMKRQQETMALYSRVGASPFSGCLPMLLQMPVLIAMFSFFPSAIELRGQSFLWAHDLSAPDVICTLPFSIPFYGNHVSLFCLLMTVVNIIYTRINMASQPGGNNMPGMKWMMYLMPVMFLFFFNDYASGLSYYYFLSLLITIIQTWVFRKITDESKVRKELLENARKPRKKSGFMARLEEAQRQQQVALRAQQNKNNNGKGRR